MTKTMLNELLKEMVRELNMLHQATIEEGYEIFDIKPQTYRKHLEYVFNKYNVKLTDKFMEDCMTIYFFRQDIVDKLFS